MCKVMKIAAALFIGVIASGALTGASATAGDRESGETFLAPRVVIYPGDVIEPEMLVETRDDGRYGSSQIVRGVMAVQGRIARKTLLPGLPIPATALMARRLVRNGSEVRLIYTDGDLTIVTSGEALQDGGVGEIIKCRNAGSGLTVSGFVQGDGSIRVRG